MSTGPQTPPPPPGPRGLMDKHELAAYLGLTVDAVTKMITKRKCPRITWINGNVRFDWPDVRSWIEEQKEQPPAVKAATPPALDLVPRAGRRRAA